MVVSIHAVLVQINVELYLAMEALKLNTKLCQREDPQIPTNGRSKKRTQQPLVLAQEREKHNVSSDIQVVFRSSFDSVQPPLPLERWLRLAIWWLI